jgi:hypothetical protein
VADDNKQAPEPPQQQDRDIDLSHSESFRKSWDQVETGPTALAEPSQAAPANGLPTISDTAPQQPAVQASSPTEGSE